MEYEVAVAQLRTDGPPIRLELSGSSEEIEVIRSHDQQGVKAQMSPNDAFVLGLDLVRAAGRAGGVARVKPIEVESP